MVPAIHDIRRSPLRICGGATIVFSGIRLSLGEEARLRIASPGEPKTVTISQIRLTEGPGFNPVGIRFVAGDRNGITEVMGKDDEGALDTEVVRQFLRLAVREHLPTRTRGDLDAQDTEGLAVLADDAIEGDFIARENGLAFGVVTGQPDIDGGKNHAAVGDSLSESVWRQFYIAFPVMGAAHRTHVLINSGAGGGRTDFWCCLPM